MAASDKALGELHEAITIEFTEQVIGYVEKDAEGVERKVRPSPALLGAAVTFLKNNNITADPEKNKALADLNEKLAARRNKTIPQATLDSAADAFNERFSGGLMQ